MSLDAHLSYACSMEKHETCDDRTCRCTCHGGIKVKTPVPPSDLVGVGSA